MYIDIHIVERNKITLVYQCISVVLQPCHHVCISVVQLSHI